MRKIVVTDASGFIGSNLVEELSKRDKVIIIDNLSTSRIGNIQNLNQKDNVKFVKGSKTDLKLLNEPFEDVYCIFHQIVVSNIPWSVENPKVMYEEKSQDFITKLSEWSI